MTHNNILILILCLSVFGCESTIDKYSSREFKLSALLEGDDALGLEGLDDNGASIDYDEGLENSTGSKLLDTFHPDSGYIFRFGRKINSINKTIVYTHDDDVSIAEIVRTINGIFISKIIDTTANDTNIFEKDFTSEFQRKVRFINELTSDNQRRWKIEALTLGEGKAGTHMNIEKLNYYKKNESENWLSIFEFTIEEDSDNFIPRDSLPTFDSWTDIKVELTIANYSPQYFPYMSGERVSYHYGRSRVHKARKKMHDDGEREDAVENDNIFTKSWTTHGPGVGYNQRVYRGFFSVIDYASLFNSDEEFHSAVWGLPYIVNR